MVSTAVIGGNGFIGKNLVNDLSALSITKENYNDCINHYEVLINANGNSRKYLPENDPLTDFDLTIRNTLKSIIDFKYNLYIYISTCEISNKEDWIVDTTKISKYALSKYIAECLVKKYCKKWLILRLNGVIGPGMKKGPIYDILNKQKLWISPKSKFQFIHTSTISEFIKLGIANEVINLTGAGLVSLTDIGAAEGPDEPTIVHNIDISKARELIHIPSSVEALKLLHSKTYTC